MKAIQNLHLSVGVGLLAFVSVLWGVRDKPLLNSPLEWYPVSSLVLLVACFVIYVISAIKLIRLKGFSRIFSIILLLGPFSYPTLLWLPNRRVDEDPKRKNEITIATVSFVLIAAIIILHSYGFKIYGDPYMYRCAPPKDEGWIRVVGFPKPDETALENGERVSLYPFYFTEKAMSLSPDELSRRFFDVPLNDLYLRENNAGDEKEWIVRKGNRYLCNFPRFFPSRTYGYYEGEFLDALTYSNISVLPENRLLHFVSEQALREYYGVERADQGNAHAQLNLGLMYSRGNGVPQDYEEAVKWYKLAANQGYVGAQYHLGRVYYLGQGVDQDYKEAVKWYKLAANQGYVGAQRALGAKYYFGEGVPQNYVLAHMWMNLASANKHENGHEATSEARDAIAAKMTPSQILRAEELAREFQVKNENSMEH
jgi:hypothetical protein